MMFLLYKDMYHLNFFYQERMVAKFGLELGYYEKQKDLHTLIL